MRWYPIADAPRGNNEAIESHAGRQGSRSKLQREHPARLRSLARHLTPLALAAAAALIAGCGRDDNGDESRNAGGVVEITCSYCQDNPTDPFLGYYHSLVERYNKQYQDKYRIKVIQNQTAVGTGAERLQYYQRLALADDLPDLFLLPQTELKEMVKTGKVADLTPIVDDDPGWKDSFHPGVFDALTIDGKIRAVPEQRDAIGIYFNKRLLRDAGVDGFPQTWDELDATCAKVKSSGKTCLAMDGEWTTLLMWANLIGTQAGGIDFLTGGITEGDYASDEAVARASETLKKWHTDGYANEDSLTGDFQSASSVFISGEAAMIANGPWYVPTDIKGKDAKKGLYDELGYEASPGLSADQRGIIIVAGEQGWASGAKSDQELAAVAAFMKMLTSRNEAITKTSETGVYPPIKITYTEQEKKRLEPLAAGLNEQAAELPLTFPHAFFNSPANFPTVWKNLWPAYVKNDLTTEEFLSQLGDDATSPTG